MNVGVLGINHKSAELELREAIAKACQKFFKMGSYENAVLLTTCNRTEIYFSHFDLLSFHSELLHALQKEVRVPFEHALYSYFGRDCFFHLGCVTSGLDSAVLGETEIQRQVKVAYIHAASLQRLPSVLHFLFQKCLKIGKEVRTCTTLFKQDLSLDQTIYRLIQMFSPSSVLFVGNSEVNRKIIRLFIARNLYQHRLNSSHFYIVKNSTDAGIRKITLSTRVPHAAESFALDHGISLGDETLLEKWSQFDVVISSTNRGNYVIGDSSGILKTRLIIDLSVPRSVDPNFSRHPSLALLNIEHLNALTQKTKESQWLEVIQAKEKIDEAVSSSLIAYEKNRTKTQHVRESEERESRLGCFPFR